MLPRVSSAAMIHGRLEPEGADMSTAYPVEIISKKNAVDVNPAGGGLRLPNGSGGLSFPTFLPASSSFSSIGSCGSLIGDRSRSEGHDGPTRRDNDVQDLEQGQDQNHQLTSSRSDSPSELEPEEAEDACFCVECVRTARLCGLCLNQSTRETWQHCRNLPFKDTFRQTFNLQTLKNRLPITTWLPRYRLRHLQGDAIAGLTVALTILSQGLAYARLVQLPPQYGLYSCFMGGFVYILFGTSKDVSIGPSSVTSFLTSQFAISPVPDDATYTVALCCMTGAIQTAMSIFHLDFIIDYISQPVIHGFTQAAAITMMFGQLPNWLGLQGIPKDFLHQVYWTFKKLSETNVWDFLMGVTCGIVLVLMKTLKQLGGVHNTGKSRLIRAIKYVKELLSSARNALTMIAAGGAVAIFLHYGLDPFSRTTDIPVGLPKFKPPAFSLVDGNVTYNAVDIFQTLGFGLFVVPLMSIVETIAIGKAYARKNRYKYVQTQELLALGVGNILGSFVSAFPISSSFSRSSVNEHSGVETPASGICVGTVALLALAFLTPLLQYIPTACLAVIIISSLFDVVDLMFIIEAWNIKKIDLVTWSLTFVLCLGLGIQYGLFAGIIFSLCILLYTSSRPKIKCEELSNCSVFTFSHGLTFPSLEYFKSHILNAITSESRSVLLDFRHVSHVDYSTVQGLKELLEDFNTDKRSLYIIKIRPQILQILLVAKIPRFKHANTVTDAVIAIRAASERRARKRLTSLPPLEEDESGFGSSPVFTISMATDDESAAACNLTRSVCTVATGLTEMQRSVSSAVIKTNDDAYNLDTVRQGNGHNGDRRHTVTTVVSYCSGEEGEEGSVDNEGDGEEESGRPVCITVTENYNNDLVLC